MKITIFVLAIAASGFNTSAQIASHSKWEENDNSHYHIRAQSKPCNMFTETEISEAQKVVAFSGLPVLQKPVWAVVTNPDGEEMTRKRISPYANTIDLHRLRSGEMYFVTIMYRNRSQKGFVLHL